MGHGHKHWSHGATLWNNKDRKSQCCHVMEKTSIPIFTSITGDGEPVRKIFVGNLARKTKYKDVIKLFSKYGKIESCFLRRNTRNRNNYALITFNSLSAAIRARNARRVILHSKNLIIEAANPWLQGKCVRKRKKKCNIVSDEDWRENEISIQKLNDDCLMHIFCYLPIMDRIRLERGKYIHFCSYSINIVLKYMKWIFMYIYVSVHRIFSTIVVCKRWKSLIINSWYNTKKLDLRSCMSSSFADRNNRHMSLNMLRKILFRCGSYLNEVDLSSVPSFYYAVNIIARRCRNLEIINITGLRVSRSGIYSLTKHCHNITKLSIGPITYVCDVDLKKLFEKNPQLRYFEVYRTPITGRCLMDLPDTLEEIVLDFCQNLEEICVLEAINKLKRIKAFTISQCDCISGNIVRFLGTCCKNLERLKICHVPPTSEFLMTDTLYITELSTLKALTVSENSVFTDEFLSRLVMTCQNLTYLDISNCSGISNRGMAAIASLQLEVLIMNKMPRVTKVRLCDASNLKRIECRRSKFMDIAIINLIKSAPQLSMLDLLESPSITNITLEEAARITASRTNNIILKIVVGGTSVDLSTFNNVSPFLEITCLFALTLEIKSDSTYVGRQTL
ncbi:hypothetical protein E2986_06903 [Frieseomelitta varia]|uniref:RRM domain-containing protein n=1 Tax=Frieseomelitta varia TaxID=561572 RepID=A0A833S8A6_9HYME|nr:hypothetical protein E2986_06903 [Frieseomelitta varia]